MTYTSTLTTPVAAMQEQRDTVNALVDAYMDKGGKITQVPAGVSATDTCLPKSMMNKHQLRNAKAREQQERADVARFEMDGAV